MADHVKTTSGTSRLGYKINAVGVFGFLVIFLWAMVAIFAPYLIPHPVGEIVDFDYFGPMTSELWLGSDYLGRDVLSRILMGDVSRSAFRWQRSPSPAPAALCSACAPPSSAAGSTPRSAGFSMR